MITTPISYSKPFANAGTATDWQNDILKGPTERIHLWPAAGSLENLSEEDVINEGSTGDTYVRAGRYRYRFMFDKVNYEQFKKMHTFQGQRGGVYLVDTSLTIWGFTSDEIDFSALTIDLLNPQNMTANDGSTSSMVPVRVSLADPNEFNLQLAAVDAISFYKTLVPLTIARLTVDGSPSATEVRIRVQNDNDGTAVLGLVQADFNIGLGGSVSGVTPDAQDEGVYVIAGTGLTSGTVALVTPATLSIPGWDGTAGVDVTI